jgi:hypothetical protein
VNLSSHYLSSHDSSNYNRFHLIGKNRQLFSTDERTLLRLDQQTPHLVQSPHLVAQTFSFPRAKIRKMLSVTKMADVRRCGLLQMVEDYVKLLQNRSLDLSVSRDYSSWFY